MLQNEQLTNAIGNFFFFFFFLREAIKANLNHYNHYTRTPISFLCRQELNLISLMQLLETLPVELTETHVCEI